MLLTKEINDIKRIEAGHNNNEYLFPIIDVHSDSYYISYSDSIHQDAILSEYSSEFLPFKKNLTSIWADSKLQCYSAVILSSIMKARDNEESVIESIQLYNYMM